MDFKDFWLDHSPISFKEWNDFQVQLRLVEEFSGSFKSFTKDEVTLLISQIKYMNNVLAIIMQDEEGVAYSKGVKDGIDSERALVQSSLGYPEWL